MNQIINRLADFLSTAVGFFATFIGLILGVAIGGLLQFNEGYMFAFNFLLSAAAIVISGVILVAGARSDAALHVKLDYLIEVSKASNKVVGIEHKDVKEIEVERKRIEDSAANHLEDIVEEEVREEVAEQLSARPER